MDCATQSIVYQHDDLLSIAHLPLSTLIIHCYDEYGEKSNDVIITSFENQPFHGVPNQSDARTSILNLPSALRPVEPTDAIARISILVH